MNALKEAAAHHKRLCEAKDRGENVTVALGQAHDEWVKARKQWAALTRRAS